MKELKMMKSRNLKAKKPAGHARNSPVTFSGHWHEWIEPKGAALLAQTFQPCHFIMKNHGPPHVRLYALRGDDMHLGPGKVRGTFFYEHLRVENLSGEEAVLIEFQFLPIGIPDWTP
jgi:hypothetical protein